MKIELFEIIQIIPEVINEILDFENIDVYPYQYFNANNVIGKFQLDDESEVKVEIHEITDPNELKIPLTFDKTQNIINIAYSVKNKTTQSKKSSMSELLKILKTVGLITEKYIKNHNEYNLYIIHATSKTNINLSDKQKQVIYSMMLSKHLNNQIYRVSDGTFGFKSIIAFQKMNSLEAKRQLKKIENQNKVK